MILIIGSILLLYPVAMWLPRIFILCKSLPSKPECNIWSRECDIWRRECNILSRWCLLFGVYSGFCIIICSALINNTHFLVSVGFSCVIIFIIFVLLPWYSWAWPYLVIPRKQNHWEIKHISLSHLECGLVEAPRGEGPGLEGNHVALLANHERNHHCSSKDYQQVSL